MGGFIVWSVYSDSLQKERRKITFPINHKSILFAFKSPYLKETSPKLVLVDAQDYVDTVSVDTNVEISSLLLQLKTNFLRSQEEASRTLVCLNHLEDLCNKIMNWLENSATQWWN